MPPTQLPDLPKEWTIDVCATCGRLAAYPFTCGHRTTDKSWTLPVLVKPRYPGEYRAQMLRAARRREEGP